MPKRITVTSESDTGRNLTFHDNFKGYDMTRKEFVSRIENNEYDNYYIREINGVKTPVSKPDININNNLG